ncbi:conjugal transfer protein TraH [Thermodesulfovibrio yellowstonii]|uniref:conjugal transfer protein TraH n=1 Tax=Thermodesulfovibrio yellowstonii TaxID=28262 RepID=UPI0004297493|nr:conjugal transfer protein TraH [Thermodesulfovibrio islandicus]
MVLKHLIVFALCIALVFPCSVYAGWLDTWFDQHISTAPNYFKGQQRGYFTAGSFSARILSSTVYPLTIERPRLKAGCGGIDVFMGGFGFTNFDYLVQKFQTLIQAAPAVAFQIALNTLSSALNVNLNEIEKIINLLNQLQLNECAITKPFTTIDLTKDDAGKQFADAATAALKSTGATNLWEELKKQFNAGSDSSTLSGRSGDISYQDVIEGCPNAIKSLIDTGGSMIDYAARNNPEFSFFTNYVKAMIGDVIITPGGSGINFNKIDSCTNVNYEMLKEGVLYYKTCDDMSCCQKESNTLRDKVATILVDGLQSIKSKQGADADYYRIVQMSPLPVHMMLKYAMVTGEDTIPVVIADAVAKGAFYQAVLDMLSNIHATVGYLKQVASKKYSTAGNDKPCNVNSDLIDAVEHLEKNLWQLANNLHKAYANAVGEVTQIAQLSHLYAQFEQKAYAMLAQKFGISVASRAVLGK